MYSVFSSLFSPSCSRLIEAAGGKVWSLKKTWQQQENWAKTREQGSNKINMVEAVLLRKNYLEAVLTNFLLVLFQRPSLKRM
ncbi:hypothetical protein HanXRQr2_Chr03g0093091 [Helianthus annuus]|uniref:Uncharacterized protein n=1 Tax=Helianthus annuus TaxID=4232 RepID=A0A9K3JCL0_HELAN|nr:hypothetical protein HanXRQr2_Chr03g0093091 [Helianthus annuus]